MKLNHKVFGQGPPVVILHGLFGMLDNWQSFAKRLASDYTVYLLDLRNHGKSAHVDEMSYQAMAQDVAAFMESEWIHRAMLVGHSMGGKVAMKLAQQHEDLIEKLIVVDIAPKQYLGGHAHIIEAMSNLPLDELTSRQQAQEILQDQLGDIGTVLFLMKSLRRSKQGGFEWKFNLPVIRAAYSDILNWESDEITVDVPTLFVRGGKSDYILDDDFSMIGDSFTNMQVVTIESADHWVHVDAPDELFQQLIKFFNTDE